jgi:hypothetical protein
MARMIEINLNPDDKTLRQFGWIALVGFGFVAAIAWFEKLIFAFGLGDARQAVAGAFACLALYSVFFSLVWPKANLPIYVALTIVSYPIGFVLSYVIMGSLFFLLISPAGIIFRLMGRDSMERKWDPAAESYWSDCAAPRPKEGYFKQF